VVSTINGDANVPFYKELGNQGIKATDIPVVAFSVGEEELAGLDTKPLVGHLAAWNYFQAGHDWRSACRRPVQRRVAHEDGDPRATVEPVHSGQRRQAGCGELDSGFPASAPRGLKAWG
jgi:hypothetical protein